MHSFSSHLSLRSPAVFHSALLFETLLLHALVWSYSVDVPEDFSFCSFLYLVLHTLFLSLFSFRSAAVVFGWSWMVSTKPVDLCGVCSVNPVNFTWHNYKRPAQELTRDCVLLRCLTRTYVHQSTSCFSLNSPWYTVELNFITAFKFLVRQNLNYKTNLIQIWW